MIQYYQIVKDIEKEFNVQFESEDYEFIYYQNVNSYIAKTNNGYKTKGQFVENPVLGNSVDFLVIAKCLKLYFGENIPVNTILENPEKYGLHIYDFCAAKKISKQYTVKYGESETQQLNRFYISKYGKYLSKKKDTKNKADSVIAGYGVMLFNRYEEKPFKEYKVDLSFYKEKINEIINNIEMDRKQLKLF